MKDTQIYNLIEEVRREQHISPMEEDDVLKGYIKDGEYDINETKYEKSIYNRNSNSFSNYSRRFGL